jgi:ABC-type amino acid transport system permease subunit
MQPNLVSDSAVTIPLPISAGLLWAVFLFATVCFVVVSWALVHHWKYYGIAGNNRVFIKSMFFVLGIGLLVLVALFIGAYSIIK